MKMNWFFNTGVAAVSLMAVVACSSTTTGTGGAGGALGVGGETASSSTTASGTGGSNPFTGTNACNDYITGKNWSLTLTESDFKDAAGYNAWSALNTCACVNTTGSTTPGCLNICSQPQNTTTTNNFCNGVAALGQCQFCLNGTGTATGITAECTTEYTACTGN